MRRFDRNLDSKRVRSDPYRRGKNTTRCCVFLFYKLGFVFLFLSFFLSFSLFVCVCVYEVCKVPPS
jgi:4-hydroxybenzoate polyprenyltransferase